MVVVELMLDDLLAHLAASTVTPGTVLGVLDRERRLVAWAGRAWPRDARRGGSLPAPAARPRRGAFRRRPAAREASGAECVGSRCASPSAGETWWGRLRPFALPGGGEQIVAVLVPADDLLRRSGAAPLGGARPDRRRPGRRPRERPQDGAPRRRSGRDPGRAQRADRRRRPRSRAAGDERHRRGRAARRCAGVDARRPQDPAQARARPARSPARSSRRPGRASCRCSRASTSPPRRIPPTRPAATATTSCRSGTGERPRGPRRSSSSPTPPATASARRSR